MRSQKWIAWGDVIASLVPLSYRLMSNAMISIYDERWSMQQNLQVLYLVCFLKPCIFFVHFHFLVLADFFVIYIIEVTYIYFL